MGLGLAAGSVDSTGLAEVQLGGETRTEAGVEHRAREGLKAKVVLDDFGVKGWRRAVLCLPKLLFGAGVLVLCLRSTATWSRPPTRTQVCAFFQDDRSRSLLPSEAAPALACVDHRSLLSCHSPCSL